MATGRVVIAISVQVRDELKACAAKQGRSMYELAERILRLHLGMETAKEPTR